MVNSSGALRSARRFQVDVMDGVFVPNITMGALAVEAVRRSTDALIEAHLMIVSPERHVADMAEAGPAPGGAGRLA